MTEANDSSVKQDTPTDATFSQTNIKYREMAQNVSTLLAYRWYF